MGYRELLKKYIRFLETNVGDNFIEAIADAKEPTLSSRDIGELKTLAGEIFREHHDGAAVNRVSNFNYRLRLLMNRFNLSVDDIADITHMDPERVRARIDTVASTFEDPEEVVRWYYSDQSRLREVESGVLEDQVVDWILDRARVTEESSSFDAILNAGQTSPAASA